ncbi:MAG: AraC family transcriptional regulator [Terriglobales bacterium]
MNRYRPMIESETVAVALFDHPEGVVHHDPEEEVADEYSISFVEHAGFEVQVGRKRWQFQQGDVFLTFPGMPYRCLHSDSIPTDRCLALRYLKSENSEEFAALVRVAVRTPRLATSNRLRYLRMAVERSLPEPALAAETCGAALLDAVSQESGPPRRLFRKCQLAWYAERVDAAQESIEQHYEEDHSLTSLARSVGMSSFHFARVFAELAGAPPHRYLLRVRLNQAARRLRDGISVTEACFQSGFANLSHFVRTFQRRFGVPPSQFRRSPAARRITLPRAN